jgi:hypothetical protein
MFLFRTPLQHLRFGSLAVYPLVACCVLLAAAQAQEAMLHDGQPALMFRADPGLTIAVDLVDHNGERALRFPVLHSHFSDCSGYLYVSQKHIAYDPVFTPKFNKDAFDLERAQIKEAWVGTEKYSHEYLLAIFSRTKRNLFYALFDSPSGKKYFGPSGLRRGESAGPVYQFISRSLSDFDSVLHDAEQLTASLNQQPHSEQQEQLSQAKEPPETASSTAPVELKEGQTPQEVEKLLGKPNDTMTLKGSLIYVYPTVKVIFENGKLADVQYQQK